LSIVDKLRLTLNKVEKSNKVLSFARGLIMTDLFLKFFPEKQLNLNQGFKQQKFYQNNFRILILSTILIIEQLIYAVFVSESGSFLQQTYFATAFGLIFYALLSLYFYFNHPKNITFIFTFYESSIGFFGLGIAVYRTIFIEYQGVGLPTVYLAVLYGLAVIFYFNYKQSFIIYFSAVLFFIFTANTRQPEFIGTRYMADIISNSIIAWIISLINYNRYVKDFINTIKIEKNNEELKQKNEKIKKINRKLKKLSTTDSLTGLFNRREIQKILIKIFEESKRYNQPFTIILVDLDQFKGINDNYGHQTGDEVLKKISSVFENNIRNVDRCGRWGGEEFLIVCPNTDNKSGIKLAERLRKIIAETSLGPADQLTASFGIATYSGGEKLDRVIERADKYLYEAKETGRNKIVPTN